MPKAEVGSTKYIANKMKSKGLQRLRWYCQICQKQCRDENGFKQHTQSEGHVRAMLLVGEDPKKYIEDYSKQFKRDFLQLLRTSHGEKKVYMNHFYQEYIRDKEHIHMNATKWPSLTEFAKYLGREGICRVEEAERGLEIQWIDDSAEAIRRREDVKRKEKLMKGDEDMEARMLERQIKQAREEAEKAGRLEEKPRGPDEGEAVVAEPVKVSLSLGGKTAQKQAESAKEAAPDAPVEITTFSAADEPAVAPPDNPLDDVDVQNAEEDEASPAPVQAKPKVSMSLGGSKPKYVNPLMAKKSTNPLSNKKEKLAPVESEKKMSNAERIMREELERKRKAEERGGPTWKKART
jgi:DNA/RNA-binding protein KIN17